MECDAYGCPECIAARAASDPVQVDADGEITLSGYWRTSGGAS